jgi:hypothetical protein
MPFNCEHFGPRKTDNSNQTLTRIYQPLFTLWLAYCKKAKTGVEETLEKLIIPHYPSDYSDHDYIK